MWSSSPFGAIRLLALLAVAGPAAAGLLRPEADANAQLARSAAPPAALLASDAPEAAAALAALALQAGRSEEALERFSRVPGIAGDCPARARLAELGEGTACEELSPIPLPPVPAGPPVAARIVSRRPGETAGQFLGSVTVAAIRAVSDGDRSPAMETTTDRFRISAGIVLEGVWYLEGRVLVTAHAGADGDADGARAALKRLAVSRPEVVWAQLDSAQLEPAPAPPRAEAIPPRAPRAVTPVEAAPEPVAVADRPAEPAPISVSVRQWRSVSLELPSTWTVEEVQVDGSRVARFRADTALADLHVRLDHAGSARKRKGIARAKKPRFPDVSLPRVLADLAGGRWRRASGGERGETARWMADDRTAITTERTAGGRRAIGACVLNADASPALGRACEHALATLEVAAR